MLTNVYLTQGIPEGAAQQPAAQQGAAAGGDGGNQSAAGGQGGAEGDLFQLAAAQAGGTPAAGARSGGANPTAAAVAAAAAAGAAAAGAGAGAGGDLGLPPGVGGATLGNLDFLRQNAQFQQLRQVVQQQPQMLEPILQQLGAGNPLVAQLIANNPEEFLELLGEEGDNDMPLQPGMHHVIQVTPEERDAIERVRIPFLPSRVHLRFRIFRLPRPHDLWLERIC